MGVFTKVIVRSFGIDLRFLEWFGLSAVSAMGNYLTPFRGGAAIRAVYLKSRYDLSYPLFMSTLTILYILTLSTSAAFGLLASLGLYLLSGLFRGILASLFLLLLLSPALVLLLTKVMPVPGTPWRERNNARARHDRGIVAWILRGMDQLIEILRRIVTGWQVISSDSRTLASLFGASMFNAGVTLFMIHFSFAAFGAQLPFLESLVLSNVFMLSSMIPITPSGLGVAEIAVVMISQGFIGDDTLSALSAGLNRSVMIFSSLILGIPFGWILGRNSVTSKNEPKSR
jgi:uncharacterized protein (TIRG00374 family)